MPEPTPRGRARPAYVPGSEPLEDKFGTGFPVAGDDVEAGMFVIRV